MKLSHLVWLLRNRAAGAELWTRVDVGGHALGCRMRPTQDAPDSLTCDCMASVWRRRARLP